ncbi:MAG: hypothetical protein E7515_04055 [Ruminococcaceae bacterium]|jgi:O-glycosyl hydrolase|nr:hypothetical protein [Oscillospiraceae bacterium]
MKKKLLIIIPILLVLIVIISVIIIKTKDGKAMKITVNEKKTLQPVYGWGTSSCWWSQNVSDEKTREEIAKYLYSKEGLALNIYRYNVGAGYDEKNNRVDNPWRLTESFLVKNEETGKWEYDFTRDKNAVEMMKKCISYGCIDTVILFANSPHYSFTVSGQSSGGLTAYKSNLKRECYEDYVDYLLTITEHFIDEGIPVTHISPINEPQWSWGGESVRQEGCHYEVDEVITLMRMFAKEIKKRGLDVKLYGPESGDLSWQTNGWFERMRDDKDISQVLGALCYHSYWSDNYALAKEDFGKFITDNFSDTRVDMSEWCELPCQHGTKTVESALIMARVIGNDMALSHANSWTGWVAVNQIGIKPEDGLDYADGLFSASNDFSEYSMAKRYYALAHYSKFIPTGSCLVESENTVSTLNITEDENLAEWDIRRKVGTYELTQSAYQTPDGKIVLVLVNEGESRDIILDVNKKNMTVYTTDEEKSLEQTYQGEKQKQITVGKNSIVTVVFE